MSLDQRKKHRIQKNIAEKLKLKRKQKPRRKLKPEDILNTDINVEQSIVKRTASSYIGATSLTKLRCSMNDKTPYYFCF